MRSAPFGGGGEHRGGKKCELIAAGDEFVLKREIERMR